MKLLLALPQIIAPLTSTIIPLSQTSLTVLPVIFYTSTITHLVTPTSAVTHPVLLPQPLLILLLVTIHEPSHTPFMYYIIFQPSLYLFTARSLVPI